MKPVTIENLEVRFEVDSRTSDERTFYRLFKRHIDAWYRAAKEAEARAQEMARDRSLGDRGSPGGM
jgi:hypothetical protein